MVRYQQNDDERVKPREPIPDTGPIRPEGQKMFQLTFFKWLFFGFVLLYILLTYYRVPMLTGLGRYLVVSHPPQKSDLIVCLAGANIERGLAAAEAYQKGLAPRVFVTRKWLPDGYNILRGRGLQYPETKDLLVKLLDGLGVPASALLVSEKTANNMFEEALLVKEIVKEKGFRSIIVVTSPVESRRAWLTFKKVFSEDNDVRIQVTPTPYSNFNPQEWWKKGEYAGAVVVEYEKLIYYMLKYIW